jgi:AcrB/AcrD/AcrF family/Integrase core domain
VTRHPTAEWLARQITETFPWATAPAYLVRDNDRAYGRVFTTRVRAMGIRDRPISPGSPWQNGCAERLIGTLRRECLDQLIIFSEMHLRRILSAFAEYYNQARSTRHYGKMRHCIGQFNALVRYSPFQSWLDCITNTSGYDFRKAQGHTRIRPVLMTAAAMIVGMLPMAIGGAGEEQNAALARAVIGGLLFATPTTLLLVPYLFAMLRRRNDGKTSHGVFEEDVA